MGWERLEDNSVLLEASEAGFELFVTADKNIVFQQRLDRYSCGLIELSRPSWPAIKAQLVQVVAAIDSAKPGEYLKIEVPPRLT